MKKVLHRRIIIAAIVIGGLGLFGVTLHGILNEPADSAAYAKSREPRRAYLAAREFVKRNLKAPATAKFVADRNSGRSDYDNAAIELREGVWLATGAVDSQNSFGALIRSSWSAQVEHAGDWRLIKLVIDGETMYSRE